MKNEKEVIQYFDAVDREIEQATVEAVRELDETAAAVAKHETALARYQTTKQGLIESIEAKNFLETFDAMLFPGMTQLGQTKNDNRRNHFQFERPRLIQQAKENYVREHGAELSAAFETLIAARSRNRDKWRGRIADEIAVLERRRLLDGFQTLTVAESRRLDEMEETLVSSDELYHSACKWAARLKIAPTWEVLTDARRFSEQIKFEGGA